MHISEGNASLDLRVEIARTPAQRARGLMGRSSIPPGTGMLFVYPRAAEWGGYWMKNTPVALDIAWIRGGIIFEVDHASPCVADPCPLTVPGGPYDHVLETAAGTLAGAGVGPGARVGLP